MSAVESAVAHAGSMGVLVVVAAGNDSVDLDTQPVWPASYDDTHVLTVAASTPDDSRADFSNHGSVVDLFAPGHLILSTVPTADGNYLFMSGTSQAAPAVAAAGALVLQHQSGAGPADVRDALASSADRLGALAPFIDRGGRLNAANALGLSEPALDLHHVAVEVDGLAEAMADTPFTARLDIAVPADSYDEPYGWEAGLYAVRGDGTYAIVDHDIAVDGGGRLTDARGAVELGASGSALVSLSTSLPAGDYALVLEAVPTADAQSRLGEPFATVFTVTDPSEPDPDPAPGPDPDPDGGGGTTDPGPGDEPAPSVPGDGTSPPSTPDTEPDPSSPTPTPSPSPTPDPAPSEPSPPTTGDDGGAPPPPDPADTTPTDGTGEDESPGAGPAPTPPPADDEPPSAAPLPTEPAPAPTAPAPSPVESGAWSIDSLTPHAGPVAAATRVRLLGNFPDPVHVWFGGQPGIVEHQSPTSIDVLTPMRALPGLVDVTLQRTGHGVVLAMPGGFLFEESVAGDPGAGSSPPPGEAAPQPTLTTAPPTDTGGGAGASGTSSRSARTSVSIEIVDLGGGLLGARVSGPDPFAGTPRCTSGTCTMS